MDVQQTKGPYGKGLVFIIFVFKRHAIGAMELVCRTKKQQHKCGQLTFALADSRKKPFFLSKFISKLDNLTASGYQTV